LQKVRFCAAFAAAAILLSGQDLKQFEKTVTEFTLANGLHFIVAERHEAPVVSFHTYVNAGSVDDPTGQTGLAHMFEHMAFKGTETIGTKDWPAEKKALDAVEDAYDKFEAERNKGPKADESRLINLQSQIKTAIDRAQTFVRPNEYTRVLEENGAVGLNASTKSDATEYFYSLPANRIELWFLMESARFLQPVFREFYKERDVVMEEHRMRVESSPQGKLIQAFLSAAFEAHPYRNPPGGWPSDIANLRRSHAQAFFEKYYVPGNMAIAIVGDVNPAEARRMAEHYFGPLAARQMPPLVNTVEPSQPGPRWAQVASPSQPLAVIGYKRPNALDKDDPVFDAIELILSGGRTGLLYRELVQEKKIALAAQFAANYPGEKYPGLALFFLVPSAGHTVEENESALRDLLKRFTSAPPDPAALARAKAQSHVGLADLLTSFYMTYGDWRKLFTSVDEMNNVTAADVQRVAWQYFVDSNRTMAYLASSAAAGRPPYSPLPTTTSAPATRSTPVTRTRPSTNTRTSPSTRPLPSTRPRSHK
jgi:predicted Zn-dependent peptidase